jgi:hypothetical protein
MKRRRIPYATKVPVELTLDERDLILNETLCRPDFANHAVVGDRGIKVDLSLDDIEEIQGYIAAEANHTRSKRLQTNLDCLFEKLRVYLNTYDDQSELEG